MPLDGRANVTATDDLGLTIRLFDAVRSGSLETLKLLLDGGANVNALARNGSSPLLHAIEHGKPLAIVEELLRHGACIDMPCGKSYASAHYKFDYVTVAMGCKASFHMVSPGQTPLFDAIRCGSLEIVKLLLDGGANVNALAEDQSFPLLHATAYGKLAIVEELLRHGAHIDMPFRESSGNGTDSTPLKLAVNCNQLPMVELLLRKGADVNAIGPLKRTPLHVAAELGNYKIVELLLDNGADVNAIDGNGETSLHLASVFRTVDDKIVKLLLDNGADVNAIDSNGDTPLHNAIKFEKEDKMVKLLLDNGADANAIDGFGKMPLRIAIERCVNNNVVNLLLEKGANVNATYSDNETPLRDSLGDSDDDNLDEMLLGRESKFHDVNTPCVYLEGPKPSKMEKCLFGIGRNRASFNDRFVHFNGFYESLSKLLSRDPTYRVRATPLSIAIGRYKKSDELVELLLDRGANVNATCRDDEAPLHIAIRRNNEFAVKLLLDRGAYVDATPMEKSTEGDATALFVAVWCADGSIVKEILRRRPNVENAMNLKSVALAARIRTDHETVDALLSHGFNFRAEDASDTVLLFAAAEGGFLAVVETLLNLGADVNATLNRQQSEVAELLVNEDANVNEVRTTNRGKTALHVASRNGDVDLVKLLLDRGADINSQDLQKRSPLHFASYNGYVEVVKLLLDRGAEINSQDLGKNTPLHVACPIGCRELIKLLLDRGADLDSQDWNKRTPLYYACRSGITETVDELLSRDRNVTVMDLKDHLANVKNYIYDACGGFKYFWLPIAEILERRIVEMTPRHLRENDSDDEYFCF